MYSVEMWITTFPQFAARPLPKDGPVKMLQCTYQVTPRDNVNTLYYLQELVQVVSNHCYIITYSLQITIWKVSSSLKIKEMETPGREKSRVCIIIA